MKAILSLIGLLFTLHCFSQTFNASQIRMHWKDKHQEPYTTFSNLIKDYPNLKFITNAGVLTKSLKPSGLYIENGKVISSVKSVQNPKVNYGIHPTGVFYITPTVAFIKPITQKIKYKNIVYAIQGGPMLLINEKVNASLPKGKKVMRNGVGIKKDGTVYFAILELSYREFAQHFKEQGCINAVSVSEGEAEVWEGKLNRTYHSFGPMISAE
jgi:uncharacterized protein YigE (DUF2233 family)